MGITETGYSLSEAFRRRMKELDIGNKELSEKSHVPLRTVNNIVLGITLNPSVNVVMDMAEALDCTIDDIVNDMKGAQKNAYSLSSAEQEILDTFRQMDEIDQAEALGIIKGMYYSKYNPVSNARKKTSSNNPSGLPDDPGIIKKSKDVG